MLEAYRTGYTRALEEKWAATFHAPAGAMWDKLIPAQSTSSTAYAHALFEWGVRTLGIETAAVQPITAMRLAFMRGAARQYGGNFLYYHAPNFGDTATTFTNAAELRRPRTLLPLALRRDDGAVALLVSEELLPLLHVRRLGHLSSNRASTSSSSRGRASTRFN